MTRAGADLIVPHMGVTVGGSIGATTSKSLDEAVALIDECAEAARRIRNEVIVIAHGGPIATPEDVSYVLANSTHCNGFYGASSMERLPTETALTAHIKTFKSLGAPRIGGKRAAG
jgi:predicted TIM-barrel enzyme